MNRASQSIAQYTSNSHHMNRAKDYVMKSLKKEDKSKYSCYTKTRRKEPTYRITTTIVDQPLVKSKESHQPPPLCGSDRTDFCCHHLSRS
ncbi:unnamed protein product [Lactuca virosa]|uniref:Uncharacterized protein n=1 Tax=Lactuca virosa TaxID=75947 RepID=A0AAU9N9N3_9ASTR|nr:unnamed protein product [Lactuca virosa]